MSEHFPKPNSLRADVKVEIDLSNHAIRTDLKNATRVGTLANLKPDVNKLDIDKLKNVPSNLSSLKSKANKLDVDKLVPVPADLTKLGVAAKNDIVKKDLYNAKIKNIEDKISDITNLATNTTLNSKKMRLVTKYLILLT